MLLTSFIVIIILAFISIIGLIAESDGKYKIQYTVLTAISIISLVYLTTA